MRGIEDAAVAVAGRVTERMPAKLVELRDRYEDPQLPDLVTVATFDQSTLSMDKWPAVLIVPGRTVSMRRTDTDGVDEEWEVRYRLRAFAYVRGQHEDRTAQVRYRHALALREVLMTSRRFDGMTVLADTISESYSDVETSAEGHSTIAAAYLEFDLTSAETLRRGASVGTVGSATVDTHVVPHHQPL